MKLCSLLLCTAGASALATPRIVVHERRSTDHGLYRARRAQGDALTTFRIAMQQKNLHSGYDYLMEVSHPSSPQYGKHWSAEDVRKAFAPSEESVEAVQAWLESNGLARGTLERGYLSVPMPIADAERLFSTEYFEHEDSEDGTVRIGCDR